MRTAVLSNDNTPLGLATPGTRAASPVRPSTLEMLTTSRPPPRRCSAACLPGSATRRLCIFRLPLAAL